MTLEQFRRQRGLSYSELAQFLGLPGKYRRTVVRRYCTHERTPSLERVLAICELTNGAVTANDFRQRARAQ